MILGNLKQLFEESHIHIVLAGGKELDDTLSDCDLLTNFPTLDEFEGLEYDDFRKTLTTIELDVLSLPEASNLADGNIFEILAASTQARMGILIKILTKAGLHSLKNGFHKVDEGILEKIASRYGTKYIPLENRNRNE